MPQIPIIMPQLGESIAEANDRQFLVKPGDNVEADQDLIEVETNKATMTVTAPCGGRVEAFTAQVERKLSRRAPSGLHRSHAGRSAPGWVWRLRPPPNRR